MSPEKKKQPAVTSLEAEMEVGSRATRNDTARKYRANQ